MSAIHIALLGYGTVGKGVFQTIQTHQGRLQAIFGKEVKIKAILVKNLEKHISPDNEVILTDSYEEIMTLKNIDVVIDAIVGKEPSYSYLQQAIQRGCHIITANKEMFAHHGGQLQKIAREQGVTIGFEATVAGGIPVIQTLRRLLNVNNIEKIEGILNGTSNFILTKMREENLPFESALKLAQEKGYAEADPTNDVEGFDAFYKAVILSELAFGEQPKWEDSIREGIRAVQPEQIEILSGLGYRFKHVATISRMEKGVTCTVKPVLVNDTHPFYHVEGVQNAVSIDGDIVGNISLQGPGAGMFPTASAIIEDLVHIHTKEIQPAFIEEQTEAREEKRAYWVIWGNVNTIGLPSTIQVIERIHVNVQVVQASEADISEVNLPNIYIYQVLGDVSKKLVLADQNR